MYKKETILCIGDSLISSEPNQWTRDLESRLGIKYKVHNVSVFSVQGAEAATKAFKHGDLSGVVVALGTNDAQSWEPEEFCTAYRALLKRIRKNLDPKVLAMILPIPQLRPSEHRCDTSILNEEIPTSICDLAKSTKIIVVNPRPVFCLDNSDGMVNPAFYQDDGISPNRRGRAAIAQAIAEALLPALEKSSISTKNSFKYSFFRHRTTDKNSYRDTRSSYSWTKRFRSSTNRFNTLEQGNTATTMNILAASHQVTPFTDSHQFTNELSLDPESPRSITSEDTATPDRPTILLTLPSPEHSTEAPQTKKSPPICRQHSSMDDTMERPTSISDFPTFRDTNRLSVVDLTTPLPHQPQIELQMFSQSSNSWFPIQAQPQQSKSIDEYYEDAAAIHEDEPMAPPIVPPPSLINDTENDHEAPRPSSCVNQSILHAVY